jgi:hypothetical protein
MYAMKIIKISIPSFYRFIYTNKFNYVRSDLIANF